MDESKVNVEDTANTGNEGQGYYDYSSVSAPEPLIPRGLLYQAEKLEEEKNKPSLGETLSASFFRSQTIPAIAGMVERASRERDEEFVIDEEMKAVIDKDYSKKESEYLTDAKSKDDFRIRIKDIQRDRERDQVLARSGLTGLVATTALSLLDPATIALGFGTGKLLGAANAAKSAHFAKVATYTGVENAIVEAVLAADNTQMTGDDILVAAGTGALFGAGSVGLQKGASKLLSRRSKDIADVKAGFREAGERGAVRDAVETAQATGVKTDVQREYPEGDIRAAQAKQYEYREDLVQKARGAIDNERLEAIKAESVAAKELDDLRSSVESGVMDKAEVQAIQSRLDSLSAKLKETKVGRKGIKKKIQKLERELSDAKGKAVDSASSINIKRAEDLLAEATARRVKLTGLEDIKEAQALLKGHDQAIKAQADLKAWDSMKESDRIKISSPDGVDNIKDKVKSEIDSADDLIAKRAEAEARYQRGIEAEAKQREGGSLNPEELEDLIFKREQDGSDVISDTPKSFGPTEYQSVGASGTGFVPKDVYELTPERAAKAKMWTEIGERLPADLIGWMPKNGIFKEIFSVATRLLNSESMGIRGLASRLVDAPQGGSQAAKTVDSQLPTNDRLIRAAGEGKLVEAFDTYCSKKGISILNIKERERALEKFNKAVFQELDSPGSSPNPEVQRAADGINKQVRVGRKLQKDAGYEGFDSVDLDSTFCPVILDHYKIKKYLGDADKSIYVKELISDSYRGAKVKGMDTPLSKEFRDLIADVHIAKAKNTGLTLKDKVRPNLTLEEAINKLKGERVKEIDGLDLASQGVDASVIDEWVDGLMGFVEEEGRSIKAYTKKTGAGSDVFTPRMVDVGGLSTFDIIKNDLAQVMEGFVREAAANASLAQAGFKSRKALLEQISDVEKVSINKGLSLDKIREEVGMLDMMQKVAYGEPVDGFSGTTRRRISDARKVVAIRDLMFSGASQIAEVGVLTAKRSFGIVMDSMSWKELFRPQLMREGGEKFGRHVREDFAELDEAFGFVGEDYILYDNRVANELMDEGASKAWEKRISNVIDKASRLSTIASLMKTVQSGLDKMALRSAAGTLKRMAHDPNFTKVLKPAEINRAGWSDGFLERELFPWMRENPGAAMYDGRTVCTFNFEKMPAEMQSRVVTGLQRLAYADIQRSYLGELPKFIHGTIGKTVAQHRNFQIASLEKQLIHGIRHDHAAMAGLFLHTAATAGLATVIKAAHRRLGEEDGIDKFLEDIDPTDPKFFWSVFQNIGLFASLGIATDLMYSLGVIPEHYAEVGGFRTMSSTSIPVVGYARDVARVPKTLFNLMQGEGVGESDSEDEGQKFLKALHKAVPGLNAIGINQALDVLERD